MDAQQPPRPRPVAERRRDRHASPTTREYPATLGEPLTSQGFDFYEALTRTFNVYSSDVAHLFSTPYAPVLSPFTLTFSGVVASGAYGAQTFTVLAPPLVGGVQASAFQTLTSGAAFRGISNLEWFQGPAVLSIQHRSRTSSPR